MRVPQIKVVSVLQTGFLLSTDTSSSLDYRPSTPPKIAMATIQALMLSGRYRTEALIRHWKKSKSDGCCRLSDACRTNFEDIPHILQHCPALTLVRQKLLLNTSNYCSKLTFIVATELLLELCKPELALFCQFLCPTTNHILCTALWP